jgi:hypothetical protein
MVLLVMTLLPGGAVAAHVQPPQEPVSHAAAHHHDDSHATAAHAEESCCPSSQGEAHTACPDNCNYGTCHCACQVVALAEILPHPSFMHPDRVVAPGIPVTVPAIAPLPPERPPRSA